MRRRLVISVGSKQLSIGLPGFGEIVRKVNKLTKGWILLIFALPLLGLVISPILLHAHLQTYGNYGFYPWIFFSCGSWLLSSLLFRFICLVYYKSKRRRLLAYRQKLFVNIGQANQYLRDFEKWKALPDDEQLAFAINRLRKMQIPNQ